MVSIRGVTDFFKYNEFLQVKRVNVRFWNIFFLSLTGSNSPESVLIRVNVVRSEGFMRELDLPVIGGGSSDFSGG